MNEFNEEIIKKEMKNIDELVEEIFEIIRKKEIDLTYSDYMLNQLKNKLDIIKSLY